MRIYCLVLSANKSEASLAILRQINLIWIEKMTHRTVFSCSLDRSPINISKLIRDSIKDRETQGLYKISSMFPAKSFITFFLDLGFYCTRILDASVKEEGLMIYVSYK